MATVLKALWLRPKQAADLLGVALKVLWGFEAAGLLHAVAPHGRGPGKRVYFHRHDVEELARTGVCKRVRKSLEDR